MAKWLDRGRGSKIRRGVLGMGKPKLLRAQPRLVMLTKVIIHVRSLLE